MIWGVGATLLSGLLLAISRDTGQFGWLVLMAPIPFLVWALRGSGKWFVFGLAMVCGLMAEAGPIWFYGRIIPLIYALAVFQALIFALSALFLRGLYQRVSPTAAIIGYAVMGAAIEYLYGLVSPNGSFGALGYAMVDVLPLLQTASVAGVAGLSFLAALIPAGLAVLISRPRDVNALAAWGVPAVAALAYGFWQLAQPSGPSTRIALLSDDRFAGKVFDHPEANGEIQSAFEQQINEAATHHPAAIVIPEKMLSPDTRLTPPQGSIIVAGLDRLAPQGGRFNIAALFDGQTMRSYLKKRMVPGLEAEYRPGHAELITHMAAQPVGIAICKDMDFAQDLRLYGRRDVALMLVPAWDFDKDAYLHGRMAVVRGVENGFAVARSASQGLMTLSDAKGRIVAEKRTREGPSMLIGDLPAGQGRTLYSRVGDVFGQMVTVVWLGLVILLAWRRKAVAP
jgi:apolipoprotein N-acyltransferase